LDGLIAAILRFDVEGMGDAGSGKFLLITVSGSLKGDKLLYDEIAMLVCAMVFFPSVEVGNTSLVMPDLELRSVA
jgi:hypothetical protein